MFSKPISPKLNPELEYPGEDDKIMLMVESTNAKGGSYTNYSSPREELTRSNAMLPNGITPVINPLHKKLDLTVQLMKRNSLL